LKTGVGWGAGFGVAGAEEVCGRVGNWNEYGLFGSTGFAAAAADGVGAGAGCGGVAGFGAACLGWKKPVCAGFGGGGVTGLGGKLKGGGVTGFAAGGGMGFGLGPITFEKNEGFGCRVMCCPLSSSVFLFISLGLDGSGGGGVGAAFGGGIGFGVGVGEGAFLSSGFFAPKSFEAALGFGPSSIVLPSTSIVFFLSGFPNISTTRVSV
jgi:hypothetical protein